MVLVTGICWCPDCHGHRLDSTGTQPWERSIALVTIANLVARDTGYSGVLDALDGYCHGDFTSVNDPILALDIERINLSRYWRMGNRDRHHSYPSILGKRMESFTADDDQLYGVWRVATAKLATILGGARLDTRISLAICVVRVEHLPGGPLWRDTD